MLYLLNGPPRSGKDTVARALSLLLPGDVGTWSLAEPLKRGTHGLYNLVDALGRPLRSDWYEDVKDEPLADFLWRTPRQCYIDVHERLWKPAHGEWVLGTMLTRAMTKRAIRDGFTIPWEGDDPHIVTDAGADPQCLPLVEAWGEDRVTVLKVRRPGCEWDNRVPLTLQVRTVEVDNSGPSPEALKEVLRCVLPECSRG